MKTNIKIGVYSYSERELAQIIRRKMVSKDHGNKRKYNRNSEKRNFKRDSSYFLYVA
ncbi:MAG: hypothetical protein J1F35_05895 [Erysipelotrichales bacterium]|nr:hypothetical protein [Erysipelotrichales bacterium]